MSDMEENRLKLKMPKGRELLGGDLLAQSLQELGVKVAFGLHGGHLDAFLMACSDIGIKLIDTRHETVGVQAAEGYSKITGKVGTCFVTANSGFCNGLPGLATALADRSPIFCVTSSPPLRDAETNCLQGFHDQVIIAKPLTKFAHRVTNVEEIPRIVAHGFRTALASPPGPVLVDFPIDVLFSPFLESMVSWGAVMRGPPLPPGPNPASMGIAMHMLSEATRPIIITGTGARGGDAAEALTRFVDLTGIPTFNSMKFSCGLPRDHPRRAGIAGPLAMLAAQGEKQPDLVILVGVRTGFLLGSRGGALLPNKDCKYIQIDVDGSEIGRSHPIELGIVSDATLALATLTAVIDQSGGIKKIDEAWVKTAMGLKDIKSPYEDAPLEESPGRAHPYHAVKKFFQSLEPGAIICMDGGEASCWAQDLVEKYGRPDLYMVCTGYLGFLGNGWGYSLGCAVADPERQVVNIQGDGSAGFHIAELDTYARHGLNILTCIVNNYVWGMSQSGQELIYGEGTARPAAKLSAGAAYEIVAEGFGCVGAKTTKVEEIEEATKKLLNSGRPGCLNMVVNDHPIHAATKSMVNVTKDKDTIVVPYYDNLPRPHYKQPN